MHPFLKNPKQHHVYKEGVTFNNILRVYAFDKKLRILIFNEIEKIEIAIRTTIVNIGCELLDNPFWMTLKENFTNQQKFGLTLRLMEDALSKSKEDFIIHFRDTYQNPYPPAWILAEILPFGIITRLFSNLKNKRVRKKVAQSFGLQSGPFESWLTIITLTRNSCCHHARVWNSQNTIRPMTPKTTGYPWINKNTNPFRIYFDLCIIKYFLNIISPNHVTTQLW